MPFTNPSIQDFKDFFVRDFPYGIDPQTSIVDGDISKAYQETNINFNQDFWADQTGYTTGYLYLSAHYLVTNIRASSQGIVGQYNFNESSKSVGSVSESFSIPQRILDNPEFSMLTKTNYGAKYLYFVLPQLSGQMFSVHEMTKP